jgi:hypothetical protein
MTGWTPGPVAENLDLELVSLGHDQVNGISGNGLHAAAAATSFTRSAFEISLVRSA